VNNAQYLDNCENRTTQLTVR